ncbi:Hypothetical protein R9X50_00243000 [Acrodontium crateriforme]|uniref:Kynurenine formamidase n=1 Tax=Acrodontium crateriforme TaxID=150365 RepID=A0AAQ3M1I1_9PEZI|nr:Hypothetical protein R9X50_00243000 [Acrodontium crateriforme]
MVIRETPDTWPCVQKGVHYSSESGLNTLDTYIPRAPLSDPNQLWVVYVHGGAWLDPEIDASSFEKTQEHILGSTEIQHISGFASINYRLSPNPSHPKLPSNPSDPSRNARHPDHIRDVLSALLFLQDTYGFDDRYVLVGHSCGATLALQVAMKRYWGMQYESTEALELNVVPPIAILGVEGLYDLPSLVNYHIHDPAYRGFVVNAFGSDERTWKTSSPTEGNFDESWPDGRLVVLAHSHGDELVEWDQVQLQFDAFKAQGWSHDSTSKSRSLKMIELTGKHDEVWEDGKELARAIQFTVREALKVM